MRMIESVFEMKKNTIMLLGLFLILFSFFSIKSIQADTDTNLTATLLSCWDMDNLNFTDYKGVYNASASGDSVTNIIGVVGNATKLGGDADYVVTDDTFSETLENFTITAWVNISTTGTFRLVDTGNQEILFGVTDGGIILTINFDDVDCSVLGSNTQDLNVGEWYHVTARKNTTDCAVYLNGTLDYTEANNGSSSFGARSLYIGQTWNGLGDYNGSIDVIKFWSSALNESQITDDYNSGAGRSCADLFNVSGGGGDSTPPVISNVANSSILYNYALITWTTDENANSTVFYGTSGGSYGNIENDVTLETGHSVALTGLTADQDYYYKAGSCDSSGNCANSSEYSFHTPNATGITQACDTSYPGSLGYLCFYNNSNLSALNTYNITYHFFDSGTQDWDADLLNVPGADFGLDNDGILANSKGGIRQLYYRGELVMWGFDAKAGTITGKLKLPHKWMTTGALGGSVDYEGEVIMDRRVMTYNGYYYCDSGSNCTLTLKANNYQAGVNTITYRTNINGSLCGFEIDYTSEGSYNKDYDFNRDLIVAFSTCPSDYTINLSDTTEAVFNIGAGTNLTLKTMYTSTEFEDELYNWTNNYDAEEQEQAQAFEDFAKAFEFPTGYNNHQVHDYYNQLVNIWAILYRCWNDSDTNCNFVYDGRSHYAFTPNKRPSYGFGIWAWDNGQVMSTMIPNLDLSSPTLASATIYINDTFANWIHFNSQYPSLQKWYTSIRPFTINTNTQPTGGLMLAANMYHQIGLFDNTTFCGDWLSTARSDYEAKVSGDRWAGTYLVEDGALNLGRDGGSLYAPSQVANTDATGWHIMSAIALSTGYANCGDNSTASYYYGEYQGIKDDMNTYMWNETWGVYANLDSSGNHYLRNNNYSNIPTSPWGICIPVGLNVSNSSQTASIISTLQNNYTDVLGYTSIPTTFDVYCPDCITESSAWNGPTWAGVDNAWCLQAFDFANSSLGLDTSTPITYLENVNSNLTVEGTRPSPFGYESYGSDDGGTAVWSNVHYIWNNNAQFYTFGTRNTVFNYLSLGSANLTYNDTIAPTIQVYSPTNTIYTNATVLIDFNATDQSGISALWFYNGSANVTYTVPVNITLTEGSHSLQFFANDTNGNIGTTSVLFQINLTINTNATNWTNVYDAAMAGYKNWMGVLHWNIPDATYGDETRFVESLLNMYEATKDEKYLNYAMIHLKNISARQSEWNNLTDAEFRASHIAGLFARFAFLTRLHTNSTYQSLSTNWTNYTDNYILPLIDSEFQEFTFESVDMGLLWETDNATRPLNQNYGYAIANAYLGAMGNSDRYDKADKLSKAIVASFWYDTCQYNTSKLCHKNPYRMQYNVSGENVSDFYGIPLTTEAIGYFAQTLENIHTMHRLGHVNDSVMENIANMIYYDAYVQEGGTTNVLIGKSMDYPATTYSNWHDFIKTHEFDTVPYLNDEVPEMDDIMEQILLHVYNLVEGGGSWTWYSIAPYENIVDPRNGQDSSYSAATTVSPAQFVKFVSSYVFATSNITPRVMAVNVTSTNTTAIIRVVADTGINLSVNYGNTTSLGSTVSNSSILTNITVNISGLVSNVTNYFNLTVYDTSGNMQMNGTFNFTTTQTTPTAGGTTNTGGGNPGGGQQTQENQTIEDNEIVSETIDNYNFTIASHKTSYSRQEDFNITVKTYYNSQSTDANSVKAILKDRDNIIMDEWILSRQSTGTYLLQAVNDYEPGTYTMRFTALFGATEIVQDKKIYISDYSGLINLIRDPKGDIRKEVVLLGIGIVLTIVMMLVLYAMSKQKKP